MSFLFVGCILFTLYNHKRRIENFKQIKMTGCKDQKDNIYHEASIIKLTGTFDNLIKNITLGETNKISQVNMSVFNQITNCILENQPLYFENKFWAGKFQEKNIFYKSFFSSNINELNITNFISGNPINNNILFYKVPVSGQTNIFKLKLAAKPDKFIGNFLNNRYFTIVDESSAIQFEITNNLSSPIDTDPQIKIKIVNQQNSDINNKFISFEFNNNINDIEIILKNTFDDKCVFYQHTRFDIIIFENNVENNYQKGNNLGYGNRFTIRKPIQQGFNNIESNIYPFNGNFGGYRNLNVKIKLNFFTNSNYKNKSNNDESFLGKQFTKITDGSFSIDKTFNSFIICNTNTTLLDNNSNTIKNILLFYGTNKQGYFIVMPTLSNNGIFNNNDILTNGSRQLLFEDISLRSIFNDNSKKITILINNTRNSNINDFGTSVNNIKIKFFNFDINMKPVKENKGCSNLYQSINTLNVKNNDECRMKCIKTNDCRVSEFNENRDMNNCLLFRDCGTTYVDKTNFKLNVMDIENFSNYKSDTPFNDNYNTYNVNGPEIPIQNYLKEDFESYKSPRDQNNNIKNNFVCDVLNVSDNMIDEETGNLTNYECSILCNQNSSCNYYAHTVNDNRKNNCKLYDNCKNLKESNNSILQCKDNVSCGSTHFIFPKTQFEKDIEKSIENSLTTERTQPISLSINKIQKDIGIKDSSININNANSKISRHQRT